MIKSIIIYWRTYLLKAIFVRKIKIVHIIDDEMPNLRIGVSDTDQTISHLIYDLFSGILDHSFISVQATPKPSLNCQEICPEHNCKKAEL